MIQSSLLRDGLDVPGDLICSHLTSTATPVLLLPVQEQQLFSFQNQSQVLNLITFCNIDAYSQKYFSSQQILLSVGVRVPTHHVEPSGT